MNKSVILSFLFFLSLVLTGCDGTCSGGDVACCGYRGTNVNYVDLDGDCDTCGNVFAHRVSFEVDSTWVILSCEDRTSSGEYWRSDKDDYRIINDVRQYVKVDITECDKNNAEELGVTAKEVACDRIVSHDNTSWDKKKYRHSNFAKKDACTGEVSRDPQIKQVLSPVFGTKYPTSTTSLYVNIQVVDPDGDLKKVEVSSTGGGSYDWIYSGDEYFSCNLDISDHSPGDYSLIIKATDFDNNAASQWVDFTILGDETGTGTGNDITETNDAPDIDITSPDRNEEIDISCETHLISASITDDDGISSVSFSYDKDDDVDAPITIVNSLDPETNQYTAEWDVSSLSNGDYTLTVTAIDNENQRNDETVTVTIEGNGTQEAPELIGINKIELASVLDYAGNNLLQSSSAWALGDIVTDNSGATVVASRSRAASDLQQNEVEFNATITKNDPYHQISAVAFQIRYKNSDLEPDVVGFYESGQTIRSISVEIPTSTSNQYDVSCVWDGYDDNGHVAVTGEYEIVPVVTLSRDGFPTVIQDLNENNFTIQRTSNLILSVTSSDRYIESNIIIPSEIYAAQVEVIHTSASGVETIISNLENIFNPFAVYVADSYEDFFSDANRVELIDLYKSDRNAYYNDLRASQSAFVMKSENYSETNKQYRLGFVVPSDVITSEDYGTITFRVTGETVLSTVTAYQRIPLSEVADAAQFLSLLESIPPMFEELENTPFGNNIRSRGAIGDALTGFARRHPILSAAIMMNVGFIGSEPHHKVTVAIYCAIRGLINGIFGSANDIVDGVMGIPAMFGDVRDFLEESPPHTIFLVIYELITSLDQVPEYLSDAYSNLVDEMYEGDDDLLALGFAVHQDECEASYVLGFHVGYFGFFIALEYYSAQLTDKVLGILGVTRLISKLTTTLTTPVKTAITGTAAYSLMALRLRVVSSVIKSLGVAGLAQFDDLYRITREGLESLVNDIFPDNSTTYLDEFVESEFADFDDYLSEISSLALDDGPSNGPVTYARNVRRTVDFKTLLGRELTENEAISVVRFLEDGFEGLKGDFSGNVDDLYAAVQDGLKELAEKTNSTTGKSYLDDLASAPAHTFDDFMKELNEAAFRHGDDVAGRVYARILQRSVDFAEIIGSQLTENQSKGLARFMARSFDAVPDRYIGEEGFQIITSNTDNLFHDDFIRIFEIDHGVNNGQIHREALSETLEDWGGHLELNLYGNPKFKLARYSEIKEYGYRYVSSFHPTIRYMKNDGILPSLQRLIDDGGTARLTQFSTDIPTDPASMRLDRINLQIVKELSWSDMMYRIRFRIADVDEYTLSYCGFDGYYDKLEACTRSFSRYYDGIPSGGKIQLDTELEIPLDQIEMFLDDETVRIISREELIEHPYPGVDLDPIN